MLQSLFRLRERGSSVRVEALGGATTFVTMAYIMVVNPAILRSAGLPVGPSTVATSLSAVFGSLLMGLWANRPIAVAPYLALAGFLLMVTLLARRMRGALLLGIAATAALGIALGHGQAPRQVFALPSRES